MENKEFWGEMLGVLKDINSLLEKQDAELSKVKLADTPKTGEIADTIQEGAPPKGEPGPDVIKNYVDDDGKEDEEKEDKKEDEEEVEKAEEDKEDEDSEEDKKGDEKEDEGEMDELKSLLKDISSALHNQPDIRAIVQSELKKALPNVVKSEAKPLIDKMLQKQGFHPTVPNVVKLDLNKAHGVEETDTMGFINSDNSVKKSEDKGKDTTKVVEDMSKLSYDDLAKMREATGGFDIFTLRGK